jgi:probable HAF family extracellular repeat protein
MTRLVPTLEPLEIRRLLAVQYAVALLDSLLPTPYASSTPLQINNKGQIAGSAFPANAQSQRAFVISKGKVTILGKLAGTFSTGRGLNGFGEVVGTSPPSTVQSQHAVIFNGAGTPTDLGTLGGASSVANAVNDVGTVVGQSLTGGSGLTPTQQAFVFANGRMTTIGDTSQVSTNAVDLNNNGVVAVAGSGRSYLFSTLRQNLPLRFVPTALNNANFVVGDIPNSSGVATDAAAFNPTLGQTTDLGNLGTSNSSAQANDVNNNDVIVGTSGTTGGSAAAHAFVWTQAAGLQDLNNLIDPNSGWQLTSANSINDAGQIVGTGIFNGRVHGFLLTPGGFTAPDTTAPTVTFTVPKQPTGESRTTIRFSVTYSDNVAINTSTIDPTDVYVVDPIGVIRTNVIVVSVTGSGSSRTAVYQFSGMTQGGNYTVHLKRRAVADTSGNFTAGQILGTFHVKHFAGAAAIPAFARKNLFAD